MTNKEAEEATRNLMIKIIDMCGEYAEKDGLSVRFVIRTVGNALIKISGMTNEVEHEQEK